MTARDMFALIVRAAGVGLVGLAVFDILHVVLVALGLPIARRVYGQGP